MLPMPDFQGQRLQGSSPQTPTVNFSLGGLPWSPSKPEHRPVTQISLSHPALSPGWKNSALPPSTLGTGWMGD